MDYKFKAVDKCNGSLLLDTHSIENGYFFAAIAQQSIKRLKLRITKGEDKQTFNLNQQGKFEIFPLQFGDGDYIISLYQNTEKTKYRLIGSIKIKVKLINDKVPFIAPNQYINYDQIPQLIQIAKKIEKGQITNREKFENLKKYISSSYCYDFIKAVTVKKEELPDIKRTLATKQGICLDLAALTVALLRIMDIPAKLTIGMADKQYHAWVQVYIDGQVIRYDPTAEISAISKVDKYTIERTY